MMQIKLGKKLFKSLLWLEKIMSHKTFEFFIKILITFIRKFFMYILLCSINVANVIKIIILFLVSGASIAF
jgi:hypothetical protein